jgi:hypothetical protein
VHWGKGLYRHANEDATGKGKTRSVAPSLSGFGLFDSVNRMRARGIHQTNEGFRAISCQEHCSFGSEAAANHDCQREEDS